MEAAKIEVEKLNGDRTDVGSSVAGREINKYRSVALK